MMQPTEGDPPDRTLLLTRPWRLAGASPGADADATYFLPDGRIGGAVPDGAASWDVADGRLVLRDRAGRRFASFVNAPADPLAVEADRRAARPPTLRLDGHRGADDAALSLTALESRQAVAPGSAIRPIGARSGRRNLVVVHAGLGTAWETWSRDLAPADRNWDLCLVWHDHPDGRPDRPDAQYHAIAFRTERWEAMHRLFPSGGKLSGYDRVALADERIGWSWSGINLAFNLAHAYDLSLAHPALDRDPRSSLRFASAIGDLCPIFSRHALALCAPCLGDDAADERGPRWAARLGVPAHRIAILDDASIAAPDGIGAAMPAGARVLGRIDRSDPPAPATPQGEGVPA